MAHKRRTVAASDAIDPDRWVEVLDGKRFVRKVRANGTVSIDNTSYYIGTAKQG